MSLLLKTIFNQISCANRRKNFLQMLLLLLITRGNTISEKNLPKNARKKPNTPKRSLNLPCRLVAVKRAKVCPYLLRNAVIDRPNQAWSIDITYIPMKQGFLYLTAIIDWYSRCIVGWDVDDTLDTTIVINACKKAFKVAKPLIINSDQGS